MGTLVATPVGCVRTLGMEPGDASQGAALQYGAWVGLSSGHHLTGVFLVGNTESRPRPDPLLRSAFSPAAPLMQTDTQSRWGALLWAMKFKCPRRGAPSSPVHLHLSTCHLLNTPRPRGLQRGPCPGSAVPSSRRMACKNTRVPTSRTSTSKSLLRGEGTLPAWL